VEDGTTKELIIKLGGVGSIVWLGLRLAIPSALKWYVKLPAGRSIGSAKHVPQFLRVVSRPKIVNEVNM